MNRSFVYISLVIFLLSFSASAQKLSNLRMKPVMLDRDTILLDSLSMVPGSFRLQYPDGKPVDTSLYNIDAVSSLLLPSASLRGDSAAFNISYRVFPFSFRQEYMHKDISMLEPDDQGIINPFVYTQKRQGTDIFRTDGLNKSGSISRGVSFGNSQDVVVNSSFNLQLSGKLSREIEILAVITDNNIPIQPEGNTQQIQEFDKVFIQLKYKRSRLIAGDFEFTRPASYFMNLYKKAQGGDFMTSFGLGRKKTRARPWTMDVHVAGAVAKGKFARNRIQGEEGNQGPYKLTGNDGETYIMVLAASEKVFIDGVPLTRGQDYDYIINYNTGEITFTPHVLITQEKRIVVEFEYAERDYARSMFFVSSGITNEKLNVRINAFSESDLKNQSLQQDLNDEQKEFMNNVGDSLHHALWPNIDSAGFSGEEIRYKMVDTLVNNILYDSVFVYSTNPDSAVYKLGFSLVGEQRGNYKLASSDANGRVFNWVAPAAGIPQGNYAPVVLLVTPKKSQMLTLGVDYAFSEKSVFNSEFSVSNYDVNTFSSKDSKDNTSFGMMLAYNKKSRISKREDNAWDLLSGARYEWVRKNFKPIEPYRRVEFNRDWNIEHLEEGEDQHQGEVEIGIENQKHGITSYRFSMFNNGPVYNGNMHSLLADMNTRGFFFKFNGSLLNSKQEIFNTNFLRNKADLSKRMKWITVGLRQELEHNTFKDMQSDSLTAASYSFNAWEAYINNNDSAVNKYAVFYRQRLDKKPTANDLSASTFAREVGASTILKKNPSNRLAITLTYRRLEIRDSTITDAEPEQVIVGRVEYFLKLFKGAITFNTYYEVGSGLEQKQSFSYLKVPSGEGVFMWIDYNGDGVEQLNEFEVAPFKDQANYIRVFTPSNEYTKTYTNQFREALNIMPAIVWNSKDGFLKFLSRWQNQTMFRIEHKTSTDDLNIAYNPFIREDKILDTSLISLNSSFRNTLYFNKTNPKYGLDINLLRNRNKAYMLNGFETRTIFQGGINLRWNFISSFTLNLGGEKGRKASVSDFFASRDYDIDYLEFLPELSYQPGPALRISLRFRYRDNINKVGGEQSRIRDLGTEINYRIVNKGTLLVKANYIDISYNGDQNTSLSFEMLEGLQTGKNGTWNVSYQQNLSDHLQLSLIYDGRKAPEIPIVHVGSLQIRAYF
ncbi:MAG: hypothetical protein KAR09_08750 [Bacteroidales bacterium]|nr:hypothetical protein [Bacteroidales bacterium]